MPGPRKCPYPRPNRASNFGGRFTRFTPLGFRCGAMVLSDAHLRGAVSESDSVSYEARDVTRCGETSEGTWAVEPLSRGVMGHGQFVTWNLFRGDGPETGLLSPQHRVR